MDNRRYDFNINGTNASISYELYQDLRCITGLDTDEELLNILVENVMSAENASEFDRDDVILQVKEHMKKFYEHYEEYRERTLQQKSSGV